MPCGTNARTVIRREIAIAIHAVVLIQVNEVRLDAAREATHHFDPEDTHHGFQSAEQEPQSQEAVVLRTAAANAAVVTADKALFAEPRKCHVLELLAPRPQGLRLSVAPPHASGVPATREE